MQISVLPTLFGCSQGLLLVLILSIARDISITVWKTSRGSDRFSMLAVFLYFTPSAAIDRASGVKQTLLP